MIMFVVDKTALPVVPPKVTQGRSRKMHYSRHVDSHIVHCTNDSNPLSSVSDVAMKVAIYQNENELNLLDRGQSSHSIQLGVGDKLKLECLSTNQHCKGQWMRDDANVTEMISGTLVEWSKITEEDEGIYTCHTNQHCTSQKITIVIDVIKNGELLSF